MKWRHIMLLLTTLCCALLLASCSSSDTSGESGENILDALKTIESVDVSVLLELDAHSGVSGLPDSHTASISSDITISSYLDPVSYHCQSFSRILVDGTTTREDKEYYVVPEDELYRRYEYTADTDTWTVSTLSKSDVLALPMETGFINDWSSLIDCLEQKGREVYDEIPVVVYEGEVPASLIQNFFGNNIFGSFLYSMEYLLANEIPCTVVFHEETGMPLEVQLDISESFIVDDMEIDHGLIKVQYSNFNLVEEIAVPKMVSIVSSDPAQEFYSSYYIWNLFLPYLNVVSSSGTAGNTGLSFESSWNTFQVRLDNGMTALPLSFSDLDHIGYELAPEYITRTLEGNKTMELVPVTKGNDVLYCNFYNDQTETQPLTACKVVGLDLRSAQCPDESIQMYLPGEVTLGVTRDSLLSAYGEADAHTTGFSADTYVWYNKGADGVSIMQQSFLAEISPVTDRVVRMYLQNTPVSVLATTNTVTNETPEV